MADAQKLNAAKVNSVGQKTSNRNSVWAQIAGTNTSRFFAH
jgi:hypothetical protein